MDSQIVYNYETVFTMSPEAEAQKVIAISLGKIAHSRIQRGGPKLCKNLLVANLIHRARTLVVDDPFKYYYQNYAQAQLLSSSNESLNTESTTTLEDTSSLSTTEVPFEVDATDSSSQGYATLDDRLASDVESFSKLSNYENKENDSPGMDTVVVDVNHTVPRLQSDMLALKTQKVPSRCMKRRNSCVERKVDIDYHRSPKRVCDQLSVGLLHKRSISLDNLDVSSTSGFGDESCITLTDTSALPVDSMDVEQISSLVSAFSNSFMDFCGSAYNSTDSDGSTNQEKNCKSVTWRANSVDIVLCAQQASNVLKMRQQVFESSSPVVA